MDIFLKENVISHNNFLAPWVIFPIFYQKYAENLSYFPKRLELFPKPWVILLQKSLSYFWIVEKKSLCYTLAVEDFLRRLSPTFKVSIVGDGVETSVWDAAAWWDGTIWLESCDEFFCELSDDDILTWMSVTSQKWYCNP